MKAINNGTVDVEVGEIMIRDVIHALPDETLHLAIERMHRHDVGRLPVVCSNGDTKLVGYLGRAAILSVRKEYWSEQNLVERGWLV